MLVTCMSCDPQVEASKYSKGVAWLEEVLYKVQIVKERISIAANKVLNSAADLKRKGQHIARAMSHRMTLQPHSSHNLGNMVAQGRFVQGIMDRLSSEDKCGEVSGGGVCVLRACVVGGGVCVCACLCETFCCSVPAPSPSPSPSPWSRFR